MLLFRSLTTGLVAACFVLIAMAHPPSAPAPAAAPEQPATLTPSVSIIDVAGRVPPSELAALVHLRPGEAVRAVGDREVHSDLAAGAAIAALDARPGSYVDLTLAAPSGERRVLLLLH